MSFEDRLAIQKDFRASRKPSIIVYTDQLGAKGLNLQHVPHVVVLQKFWNLNEMRQEIARAWRAGPLHKLPPISLTSPEYLTKSYVPYYIMAEPR